MFQISDIEPQEPSKTAWLLPGGYDSGRESTVLLRDRLLNTRDNGCSLWHVSVPQFNFPSPDDAAHYIYINAVLWAAAPAGLIISPVAKGGFLGATGFSVIGVLWWITTWQGYVAIRRHDISTHVRCMVYSFSLALSLIEKRGKRLFTPKIAGFPSIFGPWGRRFRQTLCDS